MITGCPENWCAWVYHTQFPGLGLRTVFCRFLLVFRWAGCASGKRPFFGRLGSVRLCLLCELVFRFPGAPKSLTRCCSNASRFYKQSWVGEEDFDEILEV